MTPERLAAIRALWDSNGTVSHVTSVARTALAHDDVHDLLDEVYRLRGLLDERAHDLDDGDTEEAS